MHIDLQNRAPSVKRLPDERLEVTRLYDVENQIPKTPAALLASVWLSWGTQDEAFPTCRLVNQDIQGETGSFLEPCKEPPKLVRVFLELPQFDEQLVGRPDVTVNQYGYKDVVFDYLQFTAGTAIYQIPGTTPAPSPFSSYLLKTQEGTDDGTLRTIKRTYSEGGLLADNEELKFGGSLKLRTLKSLQVVPTTPDGYTLVTRSTEFVNGLPVYSYGYANGSVADGNGGIIDDDIEYKLSPDQGATGVTVRTITYISDLTITSNPIPHPGAGWELIKIKDSKETGFRNWVGVYAFGQGTVLSDVETKEGGKLIQYSVTSINAAPSAPAPTIGGTVELIRAETRNGADATSGTVVYDYVWMEGLGEVSRAFTNAQGGPTSFDPAAPTSSIGPVRCTIRYLSALATATDPTTPPASFVRTAINFEDQDGYRVWTVNFGYGNGLVLDESEIKNGGKLILYHRIGLGSEPSAPAATIGGTVTPLDAGERLEDGYTLFDARWAEGLGEVARSFTNAQGGPVSFDPAAPTSSIGPVLCTIRYFTALSVTADPTTGPTSFVRIAVESENADGFKIWTVRWAYGVGLVLDERTVVAIDAMIRYHRVALGAAPSAPAATIGGTVTLMEDSQRKDAGYTIFDYVWGEGDGETEIVVAGQQDGALDYVITTLSLAKSTPAYPGTGTAYLIRLTQSAQPAGYQNVAVYRKPPATVTLKVQRQWEKPGLAAFVGSPPELVLIPQCTMTLLCDMVVDYDTTQISDTPWGVSAYASLNQAWLPYLVATAGTATGAPQSSQSGLGGYLGGASGISGSDSYYNGIFCKTWQATITSSTPSTRPTGATVLFVDNDIYLTATDGTRVFRRAKTSYTF
jgi:hypothetical protein